MFWETVLLPVSAQHTHYNAVMVMMCEIIISPMLITCSSLSLVSGSFPKALCRSDVCQIPRDKKSVSQGTEIWCDVSLDTRLTFRVCFDFVTLLFTSFKLLKFQKEFLFKIFSSLFYIHLERNIGNLYRETKRVGPS